MKCGATPGGEKGYVPIVADSIWEGVLDKFGDRVKSRKTRYFVLQAHQLSYYKKRTDKSPTGIIKLNQMSSVFVADGTQPATHLGTTGTAAAANAFFEPDSAGGFTLLPEPGARPYRMVAADTTERDRWIEAIKKTIGGRGTRRSSPPSPFPF